MMDAAHAAAQAALEALAEREGSDTAQQQQLPEQQLQIQQQQRAPNNPMFDLRGLQQPGNGSSAAVAVLGSANSVAEVAAAAAAAAAATAASTSGEGMLSDADSSFAADEEQRLLSELHSTAAAAVAPMGSGGSVGSGGGGVVRCGSAASSVDHDEHTALLQEVMKMNPDNSMANELLQLIAAQQQQQQQPRDGQMSTGSMDDDIAQKRPDEHYLTIAQNGTSRCAPGYEVHCRTVYCCSLA